MRTHLPEDLTARVQHLERRLRVTQALLFPLVAVTMLAAFGGGQEVAEVIKANRFALIAPDGQEMGALEINDDGTPLLRMVESSGVPTTLLLPGSLLLRTTEVGVWSRIGPGGLRLKSGNYAVALDADPDGDGPALILQVEGKDRAVLGGTRLSTPSTGITEIRPAGSLVFFDDEGNVLWSAPR